MNTDHGQFAPVFALADVVRLDTPAAKNRRLFVAEIRQYSGGPLCPIVDYVLVGDPGASPQFRLRLMPSQSAKSKVTHRALVLTLYDSLPYSDGLHNAVRDASKKFVIDYDSDPEKHVHDEFWRVDDVGGSNVSGVTVRSGDGRQKEATVEFWDYSRLTDVEGVETEEVIFVEMNPVDGAFEIWRGVEVAPGRIAVE